MKVAKKYSFRIFYATLRKQTMQAEDDELLPFGLRHKREVTVRMHDCLDLVKLLYQEELQDDPPALG